MHESLGFIQCSLIQNHSLEIKLKYFVIQYFTNKVFYIYISLVIINFTLKLKIILGTLVFYFAQR